ncbi:MAG: ABC transporter permease [Candidatus Moranbacteria bacterium]|jgi:putative ABC transport system permease protein|nr:ABC transporter permease [Candidatus Moranbacteria bacterium]
MSFFDAFNISFSSLRHNRLRTILAMLGIVIGIASVILIISIAKGATSSITSEVSSMGSNLLSISPGSQSRGPVQGGGNVQTLTYADAQYFKNNSDFSNVSAVSAAVQSSAQVIGNGENVNTTFQGVSANYFETQSISVDFGEFFSEEDENFYSKVAVIGPEVVSELFGEEADPTGQVIQIKSQLFRVIGVTKAKGSSGMTNPDKTVYVPVTTAMKILLGQNYVQSIQLSVSDIQIIDQTTDEIKQALMERHGITDESNIDFNITSSKEMQETLSSITSTLTAMLAGIAGISLLVGGIGVMNIMLVSVTERTKEIGLLKALGARKNDILLQFLIEAVVLTITGGIIGMATGEIFSYIASIIIKIPFVFQIYPILLAVGVCVAIGVFFGLYPSQRAAKLNPIDALKYE